jgi:hypothetical protein
MVVYEEVTIKQFLGTLQSHRIRALRLPFAVVRHLLQKPTDLMVPDTYLDNMRLELEVDADGSPRSDEMELESQPQVESVMSQPQPQVGRRRQRLVENEGGEVVPWCRPSPTPVGTEEPLGMVQMSADVEVEDGDQSTVPAAGNDDNFDCLMDELFNGPDQAEGDVKKFFRAQPRFCFFCFFLWSTMSDTLQNP